MARFVQLNDEEVSDLLTKQEPKNTVKSTKVVYKCFTEFIKAAKILYDENNLTKEQLDNILVRFYGVVLERKLAKITS
jgi:hypothetical protein